LIFTSLDAKPFIPKAATNLPTRAFERFSRERVLRSEELGKTPAIGTRSPSQASANSQSLEG